MSLLLPSPEEINAFYSELANNEHPVALLSTSAEYTELFETASCSEPNLPLLLSSLFKPEYCDLSSNDLQKQCEEIFHSLKVSPREALYLEQITRKQQWRIQGVINRGANQPPTIDIEIVHGVATLAASNAGHRGWVQEGDVPPPAKDRSFWCF